MTDQEMKTFYFASFLNGAEALTRSELEESRREDPHWYAVAMSRIAQPGTTMRFVAEIKPEPSMYLEVTGEDHDGGPCTIRLFTIRGEKVERKQLQ